MASEISSDKTYSKLAFHAKMTIMILIADVSVQCYEQMKDPCSGHGMYAADSCQCIEGWAGSNCSTFTGCENDSECGGVSHGYCSNFTCQCESGFGGVRCEPCITDVFGYSCSDQCDWETSCYGQGQCSGPNGTCECFEGWTGEYCNVPDCPIGFECADSACSHCSACKAGFYKHFVGTDPCLPCSIDTYNPIYGGDSVGSCLPCVLYSSTVHRTGQSNQSACVCDFGTYRISSSFGRGAANISCQICPAGATCLDGTCALGNGAVLQCADGTLIVGNWSVDSGSGKYVLGSCLDSYSRVTTSEEMQKCRACLTGSEYILNPNLDDCQMCPAGLICYGNSSFEPKVAGSMWVMNGSILLLTGCPTGYGITSTLAGRFDARVQDCAPCGAGTECTDSICTECSQCKAGFYKHFAGTDLCLACPINTYNPIFGESASADCMPCVLYSSTVHRTGQSNQSACVCDFGTYRISSSFGRGAANISCQICPAGATCLDGTCALGNGAVLQCADGTLIVGNWSVDSGSGKYVLGSCPDSYSRVTTSEEMQKCRACLTGSEYILNPNLDDCQMCPAGLICYGNSSFEPKVSGSMWVMNGSILLLTGCPTGYGITSTLAGRFDARVQDCAPCGAGTECTDSICTECSQCKAGFYKHFAGTDSCLPCPVDSYGQLSGAHSLQSCVPCMPNSTTLKLSGRTNLSACVCEAEFYLGSRDIAGNRTPFCQLCPQGAFCSDKSCSFRNPPSFECPDGNRLLGNWTFDVEIGRYMLSTCPEGYSKVVLSDLLQECQPCSTENEYILDPNNDNCQVCPAGLVCYGNSSFKPKLAESIWVRNGSILLLNSCPKGFRLPDHRHAGFDASAQECEAACNSSELTAFVCGTGFFLLNGSCMRCSEVNCSAGHFPSGCYGNVDSACLPCTNKPHLNSLYTTSASYNCTWSCNSGFFYANGSCWMCRSGYCPAGQYLGLSCSATSDAACIECSNPKPSYNAEYVSAGYPSNKNNCSWLCNQGFYRNSDDCVACNTSFCAVGQYRSFCGNFSDGMCLLCTNKPQMNAAYIHPGSPSGTNSCSWNCNVGYYKNYSLCFPCTTLGCPMGQYQSQECTPESDTVCTGCTNLPQHATFTSLGHSASDCAWACNTDYFQSGDSCLPCARNVTCPVGQILQQCAAKSDAHCTICDIGRYYLVGVCVNCSNKPEFEAAYTSDGIPYDRNNCTWACNEGFYNNGSLCHECNKSFCPVGEYRGVLCREFRDASCISCTSKPKNASYFSPGFPFNVDNCSWSCNSGFYRSQASCISCNSSSCGVGEYRGNQCSSSADNACLECSNGPVNSFYTGIGYPFNANNCTWQCNEGYFMSDRMCKRCNTSTCDAGYYRGTLCRANSESSCLPCSNKPLLNAAYTAGLPYSVNNCSWVCNAGYFTANGICVGCNTSSCSVGQYRSTCRESSDGMCIPCTNKPVEVTGVNGSQCIFSDTAYYTGSGVPFDANNCGWNCMMGFFRVSSSCSPCTKASCPLGQYRTQCNTSVDGSCIPCTNKLSDNAVYSTGNTSTGNNNCSWVCNSGFFKSGVQCVACSTSCPIGKYKTASCTSLADSVCSSCVNKPLNSAYTTSGIPFQPESCAWNCLSGTFERNGSCIVCSSLTCQGGKRLVPCTLIDDTFCSGCAIGQYQIGLDGAGKSLCQNCNMSYCSVGEYRSECGGKVDSFCIPCSNKPVDSSFSGPAFPFDSNNCSWGCDRGFFQNGSLCLACGSGTYSNSSGAQFCSLCGPGSYSEGLGASSADSCLVCSQGKYSTAYGAGTSNTCQNCTSGAYQNKPGASSCTPCPSNTYNAYQGASNVNLCLPCPIASSTKSSTGNAFSYSCLCDIGYYRINTTSPDCQVCPPGLLCFGNETVVPKVPGSVWKQNGSFYILKFCPAGYHFIIPWSDAFDIANQQCEFCSAGEECLNPPCTVCTKCKAGFYKDCVSEDPCTSCPANTYRSSEGAISLAECQVCPSRTATHGKIAQTSLSACDCDVLFYSFEGNATDCQICPPGLICYGNETVTPVPLAVGISKWIRQNDIYRLYWCPAGYQIYSGSAGNFDAAVQQCQLCGIGEECATPPCDTCTLCKPGFYKASKIISASNFSGSIKDPVSGSYFKLWIEDPCMPCPVDTYRMLPGATEIGSCLPCMLSTTTNGLVGQSDAGACKCIASMYLATPSDRPAYCSTCPAGALCPDGSCALALANFTCPSASKPIRGLWTRALDGTYKLLTCPQGYSKRVNDSLGQFSNDIQSCVECDHAKQYILDPDTSVCQTCPIGLRCSGNNITEVIVAGSQWVRDNVVLRLIACPYGHQVLNSLLDQQACSPCSEGTECTTQTCVFCYPCQAGTFKDVQSPSPCQQCDAGTYNPIQGSKTRRDCVACPSGASTQGLLGQTTNVSCICGTDTYLDPVTSKTCLPCPQSATCLNGGQPIFGDKVQASISLSSSPQELCCGNPDAWAKVVSALAKSMHIDASALSAENPCNAVNCAGSSRRAVGIQLQFTAVVTDRSALVDLLSSASFQQSFSALSNISASVTIAPESTADLATKAEGRIYGPKDSSGQYPLYGCAKGYLLINTSVSSQDCVLCHVQTYSIDPLDGCRGMPSCGSGRACNNCPAGATCLGGSSFQPIVNLSSWVPGLDASKLYMEMYLVSCPPGFQLINKSQSGQFSHNQQQCKACLPGKYIIDPNRDACQNCPKGAYCPDGASFIPNVLNSVWVIRSSSDGSRIYRIAVCPAGYTVVRDEGFADQDECVLCGKDTYLLDPTNSTSTKCLPCPVGALCPGGSTVQALSGYWKLISDTTRRDILASIPSNTTSTAILFRCPQGFCLGDNQCTNNATGPVCGICPPGWAATGEGCRECPGEPGIAPLRIMAIIILIFFGCIGWFEVSWKPIFPNSSVLDWVLGQTAKVGNLAFSAVDSNEKFHSVAEWANKMKRFSRQLFRNHYASQYAKIFISYFQVLSSFVTFQVSWPAALIDIMSWLKNTVNFDLLQLPGVSCLWAGINFRSKLLSYTLGPIFLAVLFALPLSYEKISTRFYGRNGCSWPRTLDLFWRNFIFLAFLVYPMVSLNTLQSFNCQPAGLGLLAADYRELCPDRNSFFQVYSGFFILIYPFGIPVMMLLAMWRMNVPLIAQRKTNAGLLSAMITLFVRRTSSVESQRLAQLLGLGEKEEFDRRVQDVYRTIFLPSTLPVDPSSSDSRCIEVSVAPPDHELWANGAMYIVSVDGRELKPVAHHSTMEGRPVSRNVPWDSLHWMFTIKDLRRSPKSLVITVMTPQIGNSTVLGQLALLGSVSIDERELHRIVRAPLRRVQEGLFPMIPAQNIFSGSAAPNMTSLKVRFAVLESSHQKAAMDQAALNASGLEDMDVNSVMDLLSRFGSKTDGNIGEEEFAALARKVVDVNGLFTGAENGEELLDMVTVRQLRALVLHEWPCQDMDEEGDPLDMMMERIQSVAGLEDAKLEAKRAKKVNDEQQLWGISREQLLARVCAMGRHLRDQGVLEVTHVSWKLEDVSMDAESVALRRVGFLFRSYQVEYWYWETVEMVRKFLMTSLLVAVIYPGEPAQLASGMLIICVFLALVGTLQPYCVKQLSNLQLCVLISEFVTLFSGILLILDDYIKRDIVAASGPDTISYQRQIIIALIFIVNAIVIVQPLIQSLFDADEGDTFAKLHGVCRRCTGRSNAATSDVQKYGDVQDQPAGVSCLEVSASICWRGWSSHNRSLPAVRAEEQRTQDELPFSDSENGHGFSSPLHHYNGYNGRDIGGLQAHSPFPGFIATPAVNEFAADLNGTVFTNESYLQYSSQFPHGGIVALQRPFPPPQALVVSSIPAALSPTTVGDLVVRFNGQGFGQCEQTGDDEPTRSAKTIRSLFAPAATMKAAFSAFVFLLGRESAGVGDSSSPQDSLACEHQDGAPVAIGLPQQLPVDSEYDYPASPEAAVVTASSGDIHSSAASGLQVCSVNP